MFITIIFHVWISYYVKKYDEKRTEQSNKHDCNATAVDNSATTPLNSDRAKSDGICSKCNFDIADDFYLTDPNVLLRIMRILVAIRNIIGVIPLVVSWFFY